MQPQGPSLVVTSPFSASIELPEESSEIHFADMATPTVRTPLTDVPEHGPFTPTTPDRTNSPYFNPLATGSSTTLGAPSSSGGSSSGGGGSSGRRSGTSKKPSGSRAASGSSTGASSSSGSGSSSRRTASISSNSSISTVKDGSGKGLSMSTKSTISRMRSTPRLTHEKEAEAAPSTIIYWSRAPVYGACPTRTMRGHTVTLVDSTAWVFGGCDDKETSRDIYCFDVETMQWSHPDTVGDIPPPSRAHTATLVDRKLFIFGGGQSANYSDTVYVLDTTTRRWTRPIIESELPAPRRAHTAVYYSGKIWIFGGGNGMTALNDVWTLDTTKMQWEKKNPRGSIGKDGKEAIPSPRGYHTANLVMNMMVVVGGSDGKDCFAEVWCLNLDTLQWTLLELPESYKRLSHTATQVGSYLFIQGGHNGAEYVSDMKFFNLVNLQYETRQIMGRPPTPRGYHVSILADSRLFFFGGYNGANAYDDVHIVDLAGAAYLPQVTSFTIEL